MNNDNDHKNKIAVLMATFNGALFIRDQILSILFQGGVTTTIFVRDDGSTDLTCEILNRIKSEYPGRIFFVRDSIFPTGSAAKNFFILLASVNIDQYDYVAFADQDDIWLPSKMEQAVAAIFDNGGGGYSSNVTAWHQGSGLTSPIDKRGRPKKLDYLFQGASAGSTYVLDAKCATFIQHKLHTLNVPYCDGVSHDWVIYAICRSAGFPWYYDTNSLLLYRQHSNNVYGARNGFLGDVSRARMLKNGWYRAHIIWLENVLEGSPAEIVVLDELRSFKFADRLNLIANAATFRRRVGEVMKLRIAIALGIF